MKKIVLILIISLVVIVGISSISYAYLKVEKISANSNTITLSSLDVVLLTDITSLTLDNAYPVLDEQGLGNEALSFQIKNNAVETARYMVSLVDPDDYVSTLTNKNIRYQLKRTNNTTGVSETLDIQNLDDTGLIDTGVIESGVIMTYELIMWIDYNATISGSGITFSKVVQVEGMQIPNLDTSGANYPELPSNMIPVYYEMTNETSGVWKKADVKNLDEANQWYDYNNYMWANAVTVKETGTKTRAEYLNSAVGTEISMDDILAMWVWIPRYKYVIFNGNNGNSSEQQISVIFEHAIESTGTVTCTDNILSNATSTSSQTCTDSTNGSIINNKSTYTHPAFTLGDDELTGFWAAKFEMSTDNTNNACTSSSVTNSCNISDLNVLIKPETLSLRYQNVYNQFLTIRNMEKSGNIHGFEQTGSTPTTTGAITNDSNNLDTHMIKNMEWGAISYLSQSKYGKYGNSLYTGEYKRVYKNNYYNESGTVYKTGYSLGASNGSASTTAYLYNDLTVSATGQGYRGAGASTTGSVYGVYDMNGGSYDRVMGNMVDSSGNFYPSSSGTWSGSNIPQAMYYDKYSYNSTSDTEIDSIKRGKLGDATREIYPVSNFGGGTFGVPYSNGSWFVRGHSASDTASSIFSSTYNNGSLGASNTTRPILAIYRDLPWIS